MLHPWPAKAQSGDPVLSGHAAILSDYRWRGESLTRGGGVLQAGVATDVDSLYLGTVVSRAVDDRTGPVVETYAGYARPLSPSVSVDVGAVHYRLPGVDDAPRYDYTEGYVGVSSDSFDLRVFSSRRTLGRFAPSVYAEGSLTGTFQSLHVVAGLGFLHRAVVHLGGYTLPVASVLDYRLGAWYALPESPATRLALTFSGTNLGHRRCLGYATRCGPSLTASASLSF